MSSFSLSWCDLSPELPQCVIVGQGIHSPKYLLLLCIRGESSIQRGRNIEYSNM